MTPFCSPHYYTNYHEAERVWLCSVQASCGPRNTCGPRTCPKWPVEPLVPWDCKWHHSHINSIGNRHITHLRQKCHNTKCVIFQKILLKDLKCYNFLLVQQRRNCSPAASFANCLMTLYLLKVHLQTFLSIPITQKCQNFELWHPCRKWAIHNQYYFLKKL
jgi:hypothetical protein